MIPRWVLKSSRTCLRGSVFSVLLSSPLFSLLLFTSSFAAFARDFHRQFALQRNRIRQSALVTFRPDLSIVARVKQRHVNDDVGSSATDTALQHMGHPECLSDLAELAPQAARRERIGEPAHAGGKLGESDAPVLEDDGGLSRKIAGIALDEFYRVAEDLGARKVIGRFSTFLEHVKPSSAGTRRRAKRPALRSRRRNSFREIPGCLRRIQPATRRQT